MEVRRYTACTPSRRGITGSDSAEITKSTPEKSLIVSRKKRARRNVQGKITVRHRGGGARRRYRIVDFKRNSKDNIPAKVVAIEYDPNRTTNIALLCYADSAKAYILAPQGLTIGQTVMNDDKAEARVGNYLPFALIPVSSEIHNIKLYPSKGTRLTRTASIATQLMAKEGGYTTLRLPSSEVRMVPINCRTTMGNVGNSEHNPINLGKASGKHHMDIHPMVHDSVMNPSDHPHGGGKSRAPIGRPDPYTPWDKPAVGLRTRKKNKQSSKLTVRRKNGET